MKPAAPVTRILIVGGRRTTASLGPAGAQTRRPSRGRGRPADAARSSRRGSDAAARRRTGRASGAVRRPRPISARHRIARQRMGRSDGPARRRCRLRAHVVGTTARARRRQTAVMIAVAPERCRVRQSCEGDHRRPMPSASLVRRRAPRPPASGSRDDRRRQKRLDVADMAASATGRHGSMPTGPRHRPSRSDRRAHGSTYGEDEDRRAHDERRTAGEPAGDAGDRRWTSGVASAARRPYQADAEQRRGIVAP